MKTMDELLAKLEQDGHITIVIKLQLKEYRNLRKEMKSDDMPYPVYVRATHNAALASRFLAGCLYALSSIGYISDDERKAIMENLEEGGTS